MTFRLLRLIPGLLLYGVADAFMIRAAIGVDPWTVFAQGVSLRTGLGIGLLTNLIGLLVLLLWIPLRQKPGAGTVLNILLVGPGIELGLWLLPAPESLWLRILFFTIGILLLAVASGIYIGAHLGPGPRDGLMTGIHRRFGTPIWVGRTAVEVSVLAVGWLLGGNVGLGTLAFALLIGPLCNVTLPLFDRALRAERRTGRAADDPEALTTPERGGPAEVAATTRRAR
ncbi:hypothetical protein D3248_06000 [Leucobacter zeae]|nr:hypothetical protein [Leucobacter zeae]